MEYPRGSVAYQFAVVILGMITHCFVTLSSNQFIYAILKLSNDCAITFTALSYVTTLSYLTNDSLLWGRTRCLFRRLPCAVGLLDEENFFSSAAVPPCS